MTNTERSIARRAKLKALEAINPNHPSVIREKKRRSGQWERRKTRLNASRKEDYNNPRLVAMRANNSKNKKSSIQSNPERQSKVRHEQYIRNISKVKIASAKRQKAILELEKIDPTNPRVVKFRESLRRGTKKYREAHPNRKINHSPEAIQRRRLRRNLSCRILSELRNYRSGRVVKADKMIKLLGCTIPSFIQYIESLCSFDQAWSNYGTEWVLDHYIPCAKFNLELEEHQRKCFHFSNYRPLSRPENMRKFDKLPDNFNFEAYLSQPLPPFSPTPALGTEPQLLTSGIAKQPCVL